jgi:hypothetical protein
MQKTVDNNKINKKKQINKKIFSMKTVHTFALKYFYTTDIKSDVFSGS